MPRKDHVDWTEQKDQQIRRLRLAGVSYGSIANEMGLTKGQVIGRADRIGLRAETQSEERKFGRAKQHEHQNHGATKAIGSEQPGTRATKASGSEQPSLRATTARVKKPPRDRAHQAIGTEQPTPRAPQASAREQPPVRAPATKEEYHESRASKKPRGGFEFSTAKKVKRQQNPERAQRACRSATATQKLRRKLGLSSVERFIKPLAKTTGIRFRTCQFIQGHATADESCKCGAPTDGGPWCDEHRQRIWIPNSTSDGEPFIPWSWR